MKTFTEEKVEGIWNEQGTQTALLREVVTHLETQNMLLNDIRNCLGSIHDAVHQGIRTYNL